MLRRVLSCIFITPPLPIVTAKTAIKSALNTDHLIMLKYISRRVHRRPHAQCRHAVTIPSVWTLKIWGQIFEKSQDNLRIFVGNATILRQTYDNVNFRKILKQSYEQSQHCKDNKMHLL